MVKREIDIHAPIERVFQVIRDFESYPEFLDTTKSVAEKDVDGRPVVTFKIDVMKEISYTLRFLIEEPNKVEWELVQGDLMKKNEGHWRLTSVADNHTKADYSINVEFGWMVPQFVVDQLTKTQLPAMLQAFKKRAESL